jgi:uncharacterized damage-inducible protein DinB
MGTQLTSTGEEAVVMRTFFEDFLDRLQELHAYAERAIDGLPSPALDWQAAPDMNSLAVLAMHLTGAERYWIGDVVGRDPSERDRDAEFRAKNLTAEVLTARLRSTLAHSRNVLETLTLEELETTRVAPMHGHTVTVGWALAHALEHTAIHAGQAHIIRRLWDQRQRGQGS